MLKQGLDDLTLNNEFTPSTPYVHKFRTEMCKNWELYGKCKYGDEVSKENTREYSIFVSQFMGYLDRKFQGRFLHINWWRQAS